MQRYRIYVSGPISGRDEKESREAFSRMCETLEGLGYEAVNPWDLAGEAEGHRWADYVLNDLRALRDCDGLMLLQGWVGSMGCQTELSFALGLGIPIFHEQDVEGMLRQGWMRHRLAQPREEENV